MSWKLAPALDQLFDDVNAKWPNRSKASDGTIGDAAHSARKSEHNPNRDPDDDVPDGYVTAADITKAGLDVARLLASLIGDKRVWYVIHAGKIWSRTYDFRERPYTGSNPHTGHVHVSLRQTRAACDDRSPWFATKPQIPVIPPSPETPFQRMARVASQRLRRIRQLQKRLRRAKRN
jgi:hypothetical protein